MKENLYEVGIKDKRTGEKMNLRIWAKNTDAATRKVTNTFFGVDGEYQWCGTGPLYENNKIISREIEAETGR